MSKQQSHDGRPTRRSLVIVFFPNNRLRFNRGKRFGVINYHTASPFIQRKIHESRAKEWKNYQDFQAAIPIKGKIYLTCLLRGMLLFKNIHEQHKPDFESKPRLVDCGNF